jgi:hypothetical protein
MKYLIAIMLSAVLLASCTEVKAQTVTLYGSHTTFDTLDNAGTTYLTTQAGALNNIGLSGNYFVMFIIVNL